MLRGVGRCWEVLGGVGRCWEVLGGVGRCWEGLGGIGRDWEVLGGIRDPILDPFQYEKPLLETFSFPQTVGIIGGRPRLAYYLFGHSSKNEILALDPHTVRPTNLLPDESEFICESPLIIPSLSKLDPSMALGFLVKSSFDLEDLLTRLEKTKLCAVMRETKYDFDADFDCNMPDTDDEFEILGGEK